MQDLYREHILDHYENPRQHGVIDHADITSEGVSPLCGDRIRVDVRLSDDKTLIADARFSGDGCIISQAAASMLLEDALGKPVSDLEDMPPQVMLDLVGVALTAQRVKCALLGLQTLKDGIRKWRAASSSPTFTQT